MRTLIQLPQKLRAVIEALSQKGWRPIIVGGAVRNAIVGAPITDFDIEVFGPDFPTLREALSPFSTHIIAEKTFGVIKLPELRADFSLPRLEMKTGPGYCGFTLSFPEKMTYSQAAKRRDFTINSIGYDPQTLAVIDPYKGQKDLKNKVLRHVSDAFEEDPLRVLRAIQFAARFNLTMAQETIVLCQKMSKSLSELSREKWLEELKKWLVAPYPQRGLDIAKQVGLITLYPEIASLYCLVVDKLGPRPDAVSYDNHKTF